MFRSRFCARKLLVASAQRQAAAAAARLSSLADAAPDVRERDAEARAEPRTKPGAPSEQSAPAARPRKFASHEPAGAERNAKARVAEDLVAALLSDSHDETADGSVSFADECQVAAKIRELEMKQLGVKQKMDVFQADIWPRLGEMRGRMPRHTYLATTRFLAWACRRVADEGILGLSVTLSRMQGRIGVLELNWRNALVLNLCHELAWGHHRSIRRRLIVNELIAMWEHLSQLARPSQPYDADRRFVLPSADEIVTDAADKADWQPQLPLATKALASIMMQFHHEQSPKLVSGLLATVAVLSDPRLAKHGHRVKAAPLLGLVAAALPRRSADADYVNRVFGSFPVDAGLGGSSPGTGVPLGPAKLRRLHEYVVAQWPRASAVLFDADAAWRHDDGSQKAGGRRAPSKSLAAFHTQLRAAYRSRNTGAVMSIWQDLRAELGREPGLAKLLGEEAPFLDFWIFVWCAVRRPTMVQETLDVMDEVGLRATLRSYTAMMHGWKICKDGDRVAALWEQLVKAGVRLDAAIWTERISALIESGRPQEGVEALAEMMDLWHRAIVDRGFEAAAEVAVEPKIEVVNAAFMGLVRVDRRAADEVLAWAGRHGIEPNVRTYNMLLRERFRDGQAGEAQDLLRAMQRRGIEPDAATFTVVLDEALRAMDRTSAAEQVRAVGQVLGDIKAAGLRANLETYAKMLHAVASLTNGGADEAVAAVQAHMRAAGLVPTAHMVTILLERLVARNAPPGAVAALLREHGLERVDQGDQTLWERFMSAHAVTGDVDAALALWRDLAAAGRPVTSLPCLTDLTQALLDAGRRDDARHVVRAVVASKTAAAAADGADVGRDARYWRHHLWHLAVARGVLARDEVPPGQQGRD